MNFTKLLASVALLAVGLLVAMTGVWLLIAKAKLDHTSSTGIASITLLVVGLLLVGISGGLWRSGGGGRVGRSRYRRL